MEIREESSLKFGFPDGTKVVKFDDTSFYRKKFNSLPGAKGVDFVAVEEDGIAFIEVKNCAGAEGDCRWRIFPNNRKRETSSTTVDIEGRDSLDIEVAQKVAVSLAAILGAKSFDGAGDSAAELRELYSYVSSDTFDANGKKKYVILFLEGDFGGHTRSKKMIMKDLQDSLNNKMKWLKCRVSVVDSNTYAEKIFRIVSRFDSDR